MNTIGTPGLTRFLGVSLSGGKTEKTATAQLDYYPEQKRLFVSELQSKILFESGLSSDEIWLQWADKRRSSASLTFDVPITLPPCFECQCENTQGPEYCTNSQVLWLLEQTQAKGQRPHKPITPYTQRALDFYLSEYMGHKFEVGHALGSNLAPLTVRARYLIRRVALPVYEIQPRVVSFLLGLNFKVPKSKLNGLYLSSQGEDCRAFFVKQMVECTQVFLYKQDLRYLVENYHAFNALLCAYMGYLKSQNLTAELPKVLNQETCLLPKPW